VTEKELFLLGDGEPIPIDTIEVAERGSAIRWCFTCRRNTDHSTVATAPVGESVDTPLVEVRCLGCGGKDTDLFPGREREDDQPE
jgi:hypothetical protein